MGLDRLTAVWNGLRDSLWFLPALITAGAVLLALITVQLDLQGVLRLPVPDAPSTQGPQPLRVIFSGTAEGARGVLGAIASGLITVTGVVFSVTIVALQLASTQFTPRILRNFTADRANQVVLGVFIGTFTYALLVLRVVRAEDGELGSFVPNLSVTVAVVLAVASIGFLIFFIDHAARSVQASVIIDRVTHDTLGVIRRTLATEVGEPAAEDAASAAPDAQPTLITADASGYLQGVDQDRLLELLDGLDCTLRMEPKVGDFILPGATLLSAWPAGLEQDETFVRAVRQAFILGYERTPHLDVELGVIELVDIAVKALSPGVNDPTTAVLCLDRITEIVVAYGRREQPGRVRRRPGGRGILILPRTGFDRLTETALDQIRLFGAGNPHFAATMLDRLGHAGVLLPPHRRPALARQAAALLRQVRALDPDPGDLARVERAAATTLDRLGSHATV